MANIDDFIVKIKGDPEKLSAIEGIVRAAAYNGGGSMESLLEEYNVNIEGLKVDADCHHVSLLTYLFGLGQHAQELEKKSHRNFISGCSLDGEIFTVYVYGPDGAEDFFNRLAELSPAIESCSVDAEEDYGNEEYCEEDEDY